MAATRRSFLLGAVGIAAAGITAEAIDHAHPGIGRRVRSFFDPAHHAALPTAAPAKKVHGTMRSAAMGRSVGWTIAYPAGSKPGSALPVCLAMPGRGVSHETVFTRVYLDRFLTQVIAAGTPPFAIASVDGGDHAYWHPRSYGEDPLRMLHEEFFPLLRQRRLLVDRLGLFGWSMGGFGAILLGELLPAGSVMAVAASSAALWHKASQTPDGAFDNAADFARYDAFAMRGALAGIPVRIACGESDPFYGADRDFARGLPSLVGTDFRPGAHDEAFWRDVAPGQLAFIGQHIADKR